MQFPKTLVAHVSHRRDLLDFPQYPTLLLRFARSSVATGAPGDFGRAKRNLARGLGPAQWIVHLWRRSIMRKRRRRDFHAQWDHLDDRCLPAGFTPAQITAAYGLNAISFTSSSGTKVTGDGTGQTIALIEMYSDPNIQASLNAFDAAIQPARRHAQRDQPGGFADRYGLGRGRVA